MYTLVHTCAQIYTYIHLPICTFVYFHTYIYYICIYMMIFYIYCRVLFTSESLPLQRIYGFRSYIYTCICIYISTYIIRYTRIYKYITLVFIYILFIHIYTNIELSTRVKKAPLQRFYDLGLYIQTYAHIYTYFHEHIYIHIDKDTNI
jgi:hypothetical protein